VNARGASRTAGGDNVVKGKEHERLSHKRKRRICKGGPEKKPRKRDTAKDRFEVKKLAAPDKGRGFGAGGKKTGLGREKKGLHEDRVFGGGNEKECRVERERPKIEGTAKETVMLAVKRFPMFGPGEEGSKKKNWAQKNIVLVRWGEVVERTWLSQKNDGIRKDAKNVKPGEEIAATKKKKERAGRPDQKNRIGETEVNQER